MSNPKLTKVQTTRGAKAKGRRLVTWVRERILEAWPELHPDDVVQPTTSQGGSDLHLSPAAHAVFPYEIECKNTAGFAAVYRAWDQCTRNAGPHTPAVVIKQNYRDPLVVISWAEFERLAKK